MCTRAVRCCVARSAFNNAAVLLFDSCAMHQHDRWAEGKQANMQAREACRQLAEERAASQADGADGAPASSASDSGSHPPALCCPQAGRPACAPQIRPPACASLPAARSVPLRWPAPVPPACGAPPAVAPRGSPAASAQRAATGTGVTRAGGACGAGPLRRQALPACDNQTEACLHGHAAALLPKIRTRRKRVKAMEIWRPLPVRPPGHHTLHGDTARPRNHTDRMLAIQVTA